MRPLFLIAASLCAVGCLGGCESAVPPKPALTAEETFVEEYLATIKEAASAISRVNRGTFSPTRRHLAEINERLRQIDHRMEAMTPEERQRLREAYDARLLRKILRNLNLEKRMDQAVARLVEQHVLQDDIDAFFDSKEVKGLLVRNQRILARFEDQHVVPEAELPFELRELLHTQSYPAGKNNSVDVPFRKRFPPKPLDESEFSAGYLEGKEALRTRDYDQAVRSFTEVLEKYPKSATAYVQRGNAYASLGDQAQALADYTAAIRLEPNNAEHYQVRGQLFAAMARWDKAIADYTEAARHDARYASFLVETQRAKSALERIQAQRRLQEQLELAKELPIQSLLEALRDRNNLLRSISDESSFREAFPRLKGAYQRAYYSENLLRQTLKQTSPEREPWITKYARELETLKDQFRQEQNRVANLPGVGDQFIEFLVEMRQPQVLRESGREPSQSK